MISLGDKLSKIRYSQYLYCLAAMTSLLTTSSHFVWTSPALPQLTSEKSPIGVTLTSSEGSWIVSLMFLGVAIGSLIAFYPTDQWGRRVTFLLSHIPAISAGILLFVANSAQVLYIARIMAGISGGMCFSVSPMYNAEISESDIRGRVSSLINVMTLSGGLLVYCVGPFISYQHMIIILIAIPTVSVVFVSFIPESPYFYVKNGKKKYARRSLKKLSCRSATEEFIDKRLDEITKSVENDMKNKSSLKEIFKPQYRKRLLITLVLRISMFVCGRHCIFSYLQTIMNLSESSVPSEYASIVFGVVNVITGLLSGIVLDKVGRKPVFVICNIVVALSLFCEGIYFYLLELRYDVSSLFWMPLATLILYEIFVICGLTGLPFTYIGEIFPLNVKGLALLFNTFLGAPFGFLSILTFQPMLDYWGKHVPFFIYGGCCVLMCVFGIFYLPETKGKSLAEIQNKF